MLKKALVFCAGKGKRLRPLTYFKCKPMIRIGGKPALEHIVDYLNSYGIQEIMVNLHHRPMDIIKHFQDRLIYSYEPKLLGEDGTVSRAVPWFKNDFVMVNGDTITNVNLREMYLFHKGHRKRITVFWDKKKNVSAGVWICSPWISSGKVKYYEPEAYWYDMGSFKELYAKKISHLSELREQRTEKYSWRDKERRRFLGPKVS